MHSYFQPVVGYDGHAANRRFAELPRLCPCCHHHMEPWRLAARSTAPDDSAIDFALQCARDECRRVFVARYRMGLDDEYDLVVATEEGEPDNGQQVTADSMNR